MFKIKVNLGKDSYTIHYHEAPHVALIESLKPYACRKIALVFDEKVKQRYGKKLIQSLTKADLTLYPYSMKAGEQFKTMTQVNKLLSFLLAKHWNRDDVVVVVGGGVVGDMAGFAASICLRGVALIQVPTTLLAQVDSSVGGKTGINHTRGKNLIGTFYQPKSVILSSGFLSTLNEREIKTGLAEVIKCAMIASPELFDLLHTKLGKQPIRQFKKYPELFWEKMIQLCVKIKAEVVSQDEKEASLRMILNYGHTFGHAIETLTGYTAYTHGEAIAIGMNLAAQVALKMGVCKKDTVAMQTALIRNAGLPLLPEEGIDVEDMLLVMKSDKKVKNNRLTLILPEEVGKVRIATDIDEQEVAHILRSVLK